MTNLVLFDRKKVQEQSIEDHILEIRSLIKEHVGITKAVTILIDENSESWVVLPVFCNTTNGDAILALKIIEHRLITDITEG